MKLVKKFFRRRPRVYIFPTKMGGYLNGLIFLMFLLAVGYSNNLLLIFTIFLFGMNLVWVVQTHFHLHGLRVKQINLTDGHAGELNQARFEWKKAPKGPYKWEFTLETEDQNLKAVSYLDSESESSVQVEYPNRGIWNFLYLKVKSEMPFGLYQVWIYFPLNQMAYAYPKKLNHAPPLPHIFSREEGQEDSGHKGLHDVKNLAPYQGEESRRISWKHYARTGELLIKEGEELNRAHVVFKLTKSFEDKELQLSQIATQMVQCANADVAFTLVTDERSYGPSVSGAHLHNCLKELAKC